MSHLKKRIHHLQYLQDSGMMIITEQKQDPTLPKLEQVQPAGLWHDGGKEDDQAKLGEEKPVEDPPIVNPSEGVDLEIHDIFCIW